LSEEEEADEPSSLGLGETKCMAVKSPGSPEGGRPWRGEDRSNDALETAEPKERGEFRQQLETGLA